MGRDLYRKVRRVDEARARGEFDTPSAHDGRKGKAARAAWRKARKAAMPKLEGKGKGKGGGG